MDKISKNNILTHCLKSKNKYTRMSINQINITNIFKDTEKNKEDIKKLNDIIDNLENIISKYKLENNLIM